MIGVVAIAIWALWASHNFYLELPPRLLLASDSPAEETFDRVAKREELIRRKLKDRESGSGIAAPTPADGVSGFNMIASQIKTSDKISFKVSAQDGNMLKINNTLTGKKYGIVLSTVPQSDGNGTSSGTLKKATRKTRAEIEFEVHAFELTGPIQAENVIETGREVRFLGKPYPGPEYQITVEDFYPEVGLPNTSASASCCVSCGTYQICGATVTSSCGSCTTGGPGPQPNDPPGRP